MCAGMHLRCDIPYCKEGKTMKTRSKTTNIVICGVGGQGIILASNVLCHAAFLEGNDVKKSEVHGMAQRGGTVITHVKYGKKVFSPLIEEGTADFILAFEKLEALRYLPYLKKHGTVIVNEREIPPMSVLVGTANYPAGIEKKMKRNAISHFANAERIAYETGNARVVNIVLLGVLSKFLDFKNVSWKKAIINNVKQRYVDLNLIAFQKGGELL
jgi:indolepyruvate ferredoxin oxidoreductase beta subunit